MRREILSLTEGDVVLQIPSGLALRSRRQVKAWLGVILHEFELVERSRDGAPSHRGAHPGNVRWEPRDRGVGRATVR